MFRATGHSIPIVDDRDFRRTRDYTSTLELLRLLHNTLIRIIESWERFEKGEMQYFQVNDNQTLHTIWEGHLADIETQSNELRSLRTILRQKIETFDNMRNAVSSTTRGSHL